MALYVFSDAHLGSKNETKETEKLAKIERFLAMVKTDGTRLVILGDLFDFWFEYKHAMPKDHHKVLFMLHDLIRHGVKIDYISGNHDFWMDDFFEKHIGINVSRDTLELNEYGHHILFIHGDGLAPADRGYRVLKKVLRNRLNIWLYRRLPPDWAIPLAKAVSGSSREYTARRDHHFAVDYENYAKARLDEGFDIVAIGHLHLPVFKKYDNGIYINTGDFINHFSYARIDEREVKLEYLK